MLGSKLIQWHSTAKKQGTPVHLILFVTDHCNAKCGTCFYWQNLNKGESLTLDHVQKISESLGRLVWLDISGGEPTLRKDLPTIVHRFVEHNGVEAINIPTNAIKTAQIEQIVREILALPAPFKLNMAVSLDGIGANHDRVRGVPKNWEKAVATIEALRRIREEDKRLTLSVVTTVMRDNLDDVKALLEMGVKEWQLDYHSLNILRGNPMVPELQPPTPEQYKEVADLQLAACKKYFNGRFGAASGWLASLGRYALNRYYLNELEGKPKNIPCTAGTKSCVIDANGDVYFCELLEKVGNLNHYQWDFQRLWSDFQATALREKVNKGCHCTHECFHTKNLIFSPWRYL